MNQVNSIQPLNQFSPLEKNEEVDDIYSWEARKKQQDSWTLRVISLLMFFLANSLIAYAIYGKNKEVNNVVAPVLTEKKVDSPMKLSPNLAREKQPLTLENLSIIEMEKTSPPIEIKPEKKQFKTSIDLPRLNPEASAKNNYYYLLAEFTGDRSLEEAKTRVSNANLIYFPQGIFIYLGAFKEEDDANKFKEYLQQLGMASFLYNPSTIKKNL